MDECIEKARYLLAHESERLSIAQKYYARTKAEHLWQHRYQILFKELGLANY